MRVSAVIHVYVRSAARIAAYALMRTGVQAVFAAAKKLSPAVVLIDEADALGATRSSEKSGLHGGAAEGAAARVVASLLSAMDSLQGVPSCSIACCLEVCCFDC